MSNEKKVKVCVGHQRPVPHIAYSYPVDDSHWFISSCLDGKPHLRNGETGEWVGTFEGHKGEVWQSCFSADATRVATASSDFSVKVWDALNGQELHTWNQDHVVKTIDWSDDGNHIVTGSMDKTVRLFDVQRPDQPGRVFNEQHPNTVKAVAVMKDGSAIFSACSSRLRKWDTRAGIPTHSVEVEELSSIEFNKFTNLIIVAAKGAVTLYDPFDFRPITRIPTPEDADCVAMSPDGKLFTAGCKLKVKEYDIATGQELNNHKGHHGPVFCVRYSYDSMAFASSSEDGFVRIWPSAYVLQRNVSPPPPAPVSDPMQ